MTQETDKVFAEWRKEDGGRAWSALDGRITVRDAVDYAEDAFAAGAEDGKQKERARCAAIVNSESVDQKGSQSMEVEHVVIMLSARITAQDCERCDKTGWLMEDAKIVLACPDCNPDACCRECGAVMEDQDKPYCAKCWAAIWAKKEEDKT